MASVVFAASFFGLGLVRQFFAGCAIIFITGAGWFAMMSSFNVAVQSLVPSWVRARALASYLTVFQGGFTVGSILWGFVAARTGVSAAMAWAGAAVLAGLLAAVGFRVNNGGQFGTCQRV